MDAMEFADSKGGSPGGLLALAGEGRERGGSMGYDSMGCAAELGKGCSSAWERETRTWMRHGLGESCRGDGLGCGRGCEPWRLRCLGFGVLFCMELGQDLTQTRRG